MIIKKHTRNQKRMYRIHKMEEQIEKDKYVIGNQQQEIERLNKEIETLKQSQVFIDTQDMKERYGEELYKEYLENENKKLHSIIKEVREYIKKELDIEKICRQEKSLTICKKGLLEILDKENNNANNK